MRVAFAVAILLWVSHVPAIAQNAAKWYEVQWALTDSLVFKQGLPRSALDVIQNIYSTARKDNDDLNAVKALLYRLAIEESLADEPTFLTDFASLEQEAAIAAEPVRSVLHSIIAQRYWMCFEMIQLSLRDRTQIADYKKEDLKTWTKEDFLRKITQHYQLSIASKELLRNIRPEAIEPLIYPGNIRYLRPTLYDVLAHRALDYFSGGGSYMDDFGYPAEATEPAAFARPEVFAYYRFTVTDPLSRFQHALALFQELTNFHLNDSLPDALIEISARRLLFVRQKAITEDNDAMYRYALLAMVNQYPNEKETAQIWHLLARMHADNAEKYDAWSDTSHRYDLIATKEICQKVMSYPDSSAGKYGCALLLQDILARELSMEAENVNVPHQPFRVLLNYKNIDKLYFKLIKIKDADRRRLTQTDFHNYWDELRSMRAFRRLSQSLPGADDHRRHAVEMKIDALPPGEYALLAGDNKKFNTKDGRLSVRFFKVSGIAYVFNGPDMFVLDRETGKPLSNASVQVWESSDTWEWKPRKRELLRTDINGYCRLKRKTQTALRFEISTRTDRLLIHSDEYLERSYDLPVASDRAVFEEDALRTRLFTDRSIYRPGQTVYFKGISVTTDFNSRKPKVAAGRKAMVYLIDANDERIDSLAVVTNEFGSYSGKFSLPSNRLNGTFTIVESGSVSIQVEEYKRPKFFIELDNPRGAYRVNDSIDITGTVTSYAGNSITGGSVKYRITRDTDFPYDWLHRPWVSVSDAQIAHGEVKTGTDGKFTVRFPAIPDRAVKIEKEPVFEYEITVDVTDVSGETRTASTKVKVGYKALLLSVTTPSIAIAADSLRSIAVSTTNAANEFEPSRVRLAIYKLDAPQRLIRSRYWKQPDQFLMSRQEYLSYFPYDEYSDETNKEKWKRMEKVFERTDSTNASNAVTLHNTRLAAGWYVAEAVAYDKYGQEVKDVDYIQVYDNRSGARAAPAFQWEFAPYVTAEPGETATVNVGSSARDVHIIQCVDRPSQHKGVDSFQYNFASADSTATSFSFGISENDRGNFKVLHVFVKHNRFYTSSTDVIVPWTNKELSVSFETFRDKTLPGSEERWKVKWSGHRKERAAAELLTSMYDASLDEFRRHEWVKPGIWGVYRSDAIWKHGRSFGSDISYDLDNLEQNWENVMRSGKERENDMIFMGYKVIRNADGSFRAMTTYQTMDGLFGRPSVVMVPDWTVDPDGSKGITKDSVIIGGFPGLMGNPKTQVIITPSGRPRAVSPQTPEVQIRRNLRETAFFFPDLRTDSSGNIEFSFTMPESVTQWKWQLLAHTKDLAFGTSERSVVTQKELMVQPNLPRFLREGDRMHLTAKIANIGTKEVSGEAVLQLVDAATNQPLDSSFLNIRSHQSFSVAAGQSAAVTFPVSIPQRFTVPVAVRIIAKAGNLSDGEESSVAVVSDRIMVTETLPLNVRGDSVKHFRLKKLSGNQSKTLTHHSLTLEFTSNPAWYAVQSLPYLMEYPYECAEQLWNRTYANALAGKVVNSFPRIREVFAQWKSEDAAAFISTLQQNEELKSVLLQETPWVMEGKNEAQHRKRIALLMDMVKLERDFEKNVLDLRQRQLADGAFSWFPGEYADRYITQYILAGIGHLKKLDAVPSDPTQALDAISRNAIRYLDGVLKNAYESVLKAKADTATAQITELEIHYLYARSFFPKLPIPANAQKAFDFYHRQMRQFWLKQRIYMQGMIALASFRSGDKATAVSILHSLKEHAMVHEEMGMYWKGTEAGYFWYQAPVETQALLIEAFSDITGDAETVAALKTWLLKNKQTNDWATTKATADACYALLLQGSDWLNAAPGVEIKLGDKTVNSGEEKTQAGTGYFKKVFSGQSVNNTMGDISVRMYPGDTNDHKATDHTAKSNKPFMRTAWGAVYWQYFEQIDKITPPATPLKVNKKLFIERNTDTGPLLYPVSEGSEIKVGDKIKVRIELKVDRHMEYVHMKDMRAAALEPVNVISSWKWQNGAGYYESTRDASTNFFFSYLPRGNYVFEYTVFATHAGSFSNGITTVQCMYAPEFSSYTEGIRINVRE